MAPEPAQHQTGSTIAAVATPPGVSGVAVIRLSGPRAGATLKSVAGRVPEARRATLASLRHPGNGEVLDSALVLWFPAPHSFTGEDVAELQVHGGRAVVAAVLRAIVAIDGVRLAEPGEFTRRAFDNGKLDLAAVEGLGDLLQAETEGQRRQAYAQFRGAVAGAIQEARDALVRILAIVEASIDFPDEDDVGADALAEARSLTEALLARMAVLIADGQRGERLREGVVIAIAGPPNAGKSTLLNAMARRDVAIVSPLPGTTRDSIEVHLDLGGVAVTLVDTAGLRDSHDLVEQEGMARSRHRMATADLVLWLDPDGGTAAPSGPGPVWSIRTQIDRCAPRTRPPATCGHHVSAVTGEGMEDLVAALARFCAERAGGEPAVLVRERHRLAFEKCSGAMATAMRVRDWTATPELVAEQMREALDALASATGRIGNEAILDELFLAFCIGK
jgi:tRNA modification GTPase